MHELAEASTLGDLLVRAADRAPDTTAIVFPTERVTYRQLLDGADTSPADCWHSASVPAITSAS